MHIYLVRHGQTLENSKGHMQGTIDTVLNKKGIEEAKELREKLKDKEIDVCFSSPLIRALQTAFIIVGDRCLILKDNRLRERNLGYLEGESKDLYAMDKYWDTKLNSNDNHIEPINDVYKRVEDFINYLKENYEDKNVLIVSHSAVVRCFHNFLTGTIAKPDDFKIDNCYLEEFDIKK